MGRSLVPKKEEKVTNIFNTHGLNITEAEFAEIFKKEYPKDWERINMEYIRERKGKKSGPMPEPNKYLSNTYKVCKKKLEK